MKQYKFTIDGKPFEVAINGIEDRTAHVTVNGTPYEVELEDAASVPIPVPASAPAERQSEPVAEHHSGPVAERHSGPVPESSAPVTSPLPGVIIEVAVKEGQQVRAGQKVAVLEAMKMENEIGADKDGTVTAVHVSKGDSVLEGAPIVTIA